MNIADTLINLRTIGAEVAELQRKAKEARKSALEPFLDELAKSGTVSIITVRGYTPAFNDGEPCEHSADYWVNLDGHWSDEVDMTGDLEGIFEEFIDFRRWDSVARKLLEDEEGLRINREISERHGHVFDRPSKDVMDAIEAVIFDSIEEDYGTNYYVSFVLKDGKFERHEGDYDAGY